jgi:hypothetical protein
MLVCAIGVSGLEAAPESKSSNRGSRKTDRDMMAEALASLLTGALTHAQILDAPVITTSLTLPLRPDAAPASRSYGTVIGSPFIDCGWIESVGYGCPGRYPHRTVSR